MTDSPSTAQLSDEHYQQHTKQWVKSFVVEYNICPFAKRELERGSIRYAVNGSDDVENLLQQLIAECQLLDEQADIETTMFIVPALQDFHDYLDMLNWAEQLVSKQGYDGVYQLASFHPDYCFAGEPANEPSNYTNRSPYATLHLIREKTISRLTKLHPDPEGIPDRNIQVTEDLGSAALKQLLASCKN
ncbi:DUF1415 domain-containing protein [Agarivorans sp. Toyoura001]|uniref:DUF1415 domain-containing protein n=1 Tax=unclassified Agarivorans TaxID=2636026 RepID=UPI0010E70208|nr:DUF1415 domain-containing protein [Agarivorans sp. Toyoura001]GDY24754.1 DUF1415 domain-containing protein [Agarivorans sp. Toyoura001]